MLVDVCDVDKLPYHVTIIAVQSTGQHSCAMPAV